MNRPVSALFAIASAAAALLAVVPAAAQSFTTYVQNYDGTTMTPTGTSGGAGRATVTAGQSVTIKAPRGANYDDASQSAAALVTVAGATQTVGGVTFTNQANSGADALNVNWQYTPTTTGPGYEGFTTSGSINQRPIVDNGGTVSFKEYVFSSMGSSVNTTLEIEQNTTSYYNADTATDTVTPITAASPAPANVLGQRGTDATETDVYFVGADGTTATGGTSGTTGFPAGGKNVTGGSWQTVTFNLPTEAHELLLGTAAYKTSGLGAIYGMDFIPVNPQSGEVFSVYIDDLTITAAPAAAPEPSSWAAMGVGAFALLALGLRARRRSAGQIAC